VEERRAAVPKRKDKRGLGQKFNEDGQVVCCNNYGTDTACRAPAQDNVQASTMEVGGSAGLASLACV
jgi:hypothetical protein